ncbi:hypothetical protein KCP75_18670 [Salmonella enterica subsp. enterica]|nr:hypothetical protein KCP75_18670 [Salmonella enterica subsp. enterica]
MRLEEIDVRGYSCNAWTTQANGLAITRCLRVAFCASVASGELAAELPEIHRYGRGSWMEQGFSQRSYTSHALAAECDAQMLPRYIATMRGGCLITVNWHCWKGH